MTECFECAALPERPDAMGPGIGAGPFRPRPPRRVVSGVRKPRCFTHDLAEKRRAKAAAHDTNTQRIYGVPEGWYAEQYERQGRKCAFPKCRATGKTKRLAVDHDRKKAVTSAPDHPQAHAVDRACRYCVRGLLCGPHNYDLMGRFAVDLEDAILYRDWPPAQKWRWTGEPQEVTGERHAG